MKILMVLDKPNLYGSELHLLDLTDYFSRIEKVKVLALSEGPLLKLLSERSVEYTVINSGWLSSVNFITKARKLIKTFAPDIIHSHQPKANFLITFLNLFIKVRNVITIHSQALDHSLVHKNLLKRKLVYLFHRFVQYVSEAGATKIIYVSSSASKTSFHKNKVEVIYNWLGKNRQTFSSPRQPAEGVIKMVSVGSVTYAKGFDLLADFAGRLTMQYEIHIVGSDENDFAIQLKERVKKEKLNITFHGYQTDLPVFFDDANFFVLFSRSETFGLSYIEAMSAGLPVLALDYDTMNEILPAGNSISNDLSKHVEYIKDVSANPEQFEIVSTANRKYVNENFSYENAMKKYEKLYSSIVA